jgi:tetratricopeptide (TPR) repeat protein
MKLVHNSLKKTEEELSRSQRTRKLEKDGKSVEAADEYEKIIKTEPFNQSAYERLMIIYRKEKNFKKELAILNVGIKAFNDLYKASVKRNPSSKTIQLSKALLKLTGLSDKKGKPLYQREPVGKWSRRKLVLVTKMKQQK